RDRTVTGVQTCALPIFAGVLADQVGTAPAPETARLIDRIREARLGRRVAAAPAAAAARRRPPLCGRAAELAALVAAWERTKGGRSEERRVGEVLRWLV